MHMKRSSFPSDQVGAQPAWRQEAKLLNASKKDYEERRCAPHSFRLLTEHFLPQIVPQQFRADLNQYFHNYPRERFMRITRCSIDTGMIWPCNLQGNVPSLTIPFSAFLLS